MQKKLFSVLLIFSIVLTSFCFPANVSAQNTSTTIKNVIYMIPDGGAMAPFYLADAVKKEGGFDKTLYPNVTQVEASEMYMKQYLVGAETTYSANNAVTDSAASGTALSSGYKTNNNYIGIDPYGRPHANILEVCQDAGKNTGMVVTYEWTNATPATFSAHDISRSNMKTMSEQIVNQGIDVVLGNTHGDFRNEEWFTDSALTERGYDIIKTKSDLLSVKAGDRLWGKLPAAYYDYNRAETTPNLAELTHAAITALDDGNENGFFLMVEGSAVDGGGHDNDAVKMVSEYLAFDAACKIAIEYAKGRTDTIVIIAPDHDTGGLSYNYSNLGKIIDEIQVGKNPSDIAWESKGHSARNGGIFMYLPEGIDYPAGIDITKSSDVASEFYNAYGNFSKAYPNNATNVIDNTNIPKYIASLINVDFDKVTEKLFVDITDRGWYNASTEVFTFNKKDVSVKRNSSTVYINGQPIDLDGEIAICIGSKFYVPKKLLELEAEVEEVDEDGGITVYADYNTGKLTFSGEIGIPNIPVTTIVTKPEASFNINSEDDIAYLGEVMSDDKGNYSFSTFVDRLAGEYAIFVNYSHGLTSPIHANFTLKNTIPVLSVTTDGTAFSKMDQVLVGDVIDIELSGFEFEEDFESVVIVAQYNNNSLLDILYMPIKGSTVNYGDEFKDDFTVVNGADKIKVFYWNANTCAPLLASYTID